MKKIIRNSAAFFLLLAVLVACNEEDTQNSPISEQSTNLKIPNDMGGIRFGGVVLPKGTKSEVSNDGSTLKVYLPEGILYVASLNNELIETDKGGYTCTSTCDGGCDVVKLGEDIGCTACPEGSTEACTGKREDVGIYSIGQGSGGGFINLDQGISFVTSSDKKVGNFQTPDWDVLVQHPKVEKQLTSFINELWPEGDIDLNNSDLALVNVFGTYIRMNVPNGFANTRVANEIISGDDVSCDCSSGEGGCVHEEITIGAGLFKKKIGDKCVAGGCESCTMSW